MFIQQILDVYCVTAYALQYQKLFYFSYRSKAGGRSSLDPFGQQPPIIRPIRTIWTPKNAVTQCALPKSTSQEKFLRGKFCKPMTKKQNNRKLAHYLTSPLPPANPSEIHRDPPPQKKKITYSSRWSWCS